MNNPSGNPCKVHHFHKDGICCMCGGQKGVVEFK